MTFSVLVRGVIKFITYPLRILYFHGPRLGGYGFQEGYSKEMICSSMTSVRSEFWLMSVENMYECEILLENKFYGFVIGFFALLLICGIVSNLYLISIQHYLSRPIGAIIEKKIESSFIKFKKNQRTHSQVEL